MVVQILCSLLHGKGDVVDHKQGSVPLDEVFNWCTTAPVFTALSLLRCSPGAPVFAARAARPGVSESSSGHRPHELRLPPPRARYPWPVADVGAARGGMLRHPASIGKGSPQQHLDLRVEAARL